MPSASGPAGWLDAPYREVLALIGCARDQVFGRAITLEIGAGSATWGACPLRVAGDGERDGRGHRGGINHCEPICLIVNPSWLWKRGWALFFLCAGDRGVERHWRF